MRYFPIIIIFHLMSSCGCRELNTDEKKSKETNITGIQMQDSMFTKLIDVTGSGIPEEELADSLVFLIVPLRESCPSCLSKTLDSIMKYKNNLKRNRYIIISLNGGRKTADSYFREQKGELPVMAGQLFLDTMNKASTYKLFDNNPAIYYTANKKVKKFISVLPETVHKDLRSFFKYQRSN